MAQTIKLKRSSTSGAAPTTSQLELGEVAINTYDGKMYIKKDVGGTESIVEITGGGSGGGSGLASSFTLYEYTATANQTTFSGSDSNSNTLAYDTATPPKILVYLNGVLLDHTTDYTATNGTSVVLTSAAAASDLIQVAAYKSEASVALDIDLADNVKLKFGDDDDLQIYHDGSHSRIKDTGTGNLILNTQAFRVNGADDAEGMIKANQDGNVELYYDGSKKLETTSIGATITGNIVVTGTVDGRDLATDGSKLDNIESNADVTDAVNVTAAGALMDSEVTNLAQVKAFDSSDYATAAQGSTADSAMQDLVDDTTPQLGGNLDLNSSDITGTGNIDVTGSVTSDSLVISGTNANLTLGASGNDITFGRNADNYINAQTGTSSNIIINPENRFVVNTSDTERFRIDSAGNILHQSGSPEYHFGTTSASHYNWRVAAQEAVNAGFEIASGTQSAGSGALSDTYTTRFVIKGDTGNVGIGETDPGARLEVKSSGTGKSSGIRLSDINGTERGNFYFGGAQNFVIHGASGPAGADAPALQFATGGSTPAVRMTILEEGNVGIGTASPISKLHLADSSANSIVQTRFVNDARDYALGVHGGLSDSFVLYDDTADATRLVVTTAGNVGIGTTAPSAPLSLLDASLTTQGTGEGGLRVHRPNAASQYGYFDYGYNGGGVNIGSFYSGGGASSFGTFTFRQHSSTTSQIPMFIDNGGDVGIGTTSPDSKLTVNTTTTGDGIELQSSEVSIAKLSRHVVSSTVVASLDGVSGRPIHVGGAVNEDVILANAGGNVAIGNTTASAKLDIRQDSGYAIRVENGSGHYFRVAAGGAIEVGGSAFVDASRNITAGTISSGNITTSGYLAGPATFTIDPAAVGDNTGTVVIAGNLQVDGTTTTINSTTLTVDDKNITLASGSSNAAAANGAGITVDCGSGTDATFIYDGTNDEWDFNKNVKVSGSVGVTNIVTNKVVKFNGTVLDDSTITDTGSLITLGTSTDVSGPLQFTSNVSFSSSESGRIYKSSQHGLAFHAVTGTENDFAMFTPAGQLMIVNPTGTNNVALIPTAGGNVGIGTASPSYTLTLKDDSANTYIRFENTTTSLGWIGYHGDGDLSFWTNASTRSMNITSSGNVGIGIEAAAAKLQIEEAGIDTTTTSTTATTQVAIDTFAAATFRSARYTIQVTNSTDSTYHLTEILLIHDGTTPQITEYGTIFTGSAEATFDADISSSNVRLLATPATTDSMTFKVVRHCITV